MTDFIEQFNSVEWLEIKNLVDRKHLKMTKNSILLSQKILEQTGILVYPVIFRTYASQNMLKQCAFSWTMYKKNMQEVGSIDTVKTCLKKSNRLFVDTSWKDIEIIAEEVKE